jgi:hypothetical protein
MPWREYLNRAVEGGRRKLAIPSGVYNLRVLGDHAKGRTDAMAEIILQAAFLRSADLIPTGTKPISASGAHYQDFRNPGTPDYVMAHRATLTVAVGGLKFVDFISQRYSLQEMLIAPQARTDPLPPPGNYGDVLSRSSPRTRRWHWSKGFSESRNPDARYKGDVSWLR